MKDEASEFVTQNTRGEGLFNRLMVCKYFNFLSLVACGDDILSMIDVRGSLFSVVDPLK